MELAERLKLEVLGIYQECISGEVDPRNRLIFTDALQDGQINGGRILVAKLDRFSRNVFHISGFCGGHFFGINTPHLLVAESPEMKQFELHIKAALAEEERRMISKRTKEALAVARLNGKELGKVGRETKLKKDREATKEAINRAIELRILNYSYGKIADTLNAEGYTTSKGGKWYAANIRERINNQSIVE